MAEKKSSATTPSTVDSAGLTLAERLFVRNWNPTEQKTNEWLAEKCLKAAKEFNETAENTGGSSNS